jgi:membrane protein
LQLSWFIVLFGAEFSFAHQNVDTYEFEPDSRRISDSFKRLVALYISHLLVSNFAKGEKPLTAPQICHRLEIPIRLANRILHELVASGIVSDIQTEEDKEVAYQPARDINSLTVKFVLESLEDKGVDTIPVAQTAESKALSEILTAFRDEIEQSPSNRLLKDI